METGMTDKLAVTCIEFRPRRKNTLRGFATIEVRELRLRISDVALHAKGNSRWVALPSKLQIDNDGVSIKRESKIQYSPILAFTDRKTADAFGHRVIEAVLALVPDAFTDAFAKQRILKQRRRPND
jgi:hypothetical protein